MTAPEAWQGEEEHAEGPGKAHPAGQRSGSRIGHSEAPKTSDALRAALGETPPSAASRASDRPLSTPDAVQVMPLSRAPQGPPISPRMSAVFGGVFGLATIASIFALLIQVFPVDEQPRPVPRAATASVTAPTTSRAAVTDEKWFKKRQHTPLPGPWRLSKLKGAPGIRIVRGTMKRRSFIKALKEAGVPKAEVYRILKSLKDVNKFARCGRRDKFAVALQRPENKVVAFEYEISPIKIYQSRTDSNGLLQGDRLDMKVREEAFTTAFYVTKDIHHSYRAVGLEDGVLNVINDALNGQTSTEAFKEGGVVRLILVEQTALGRFVRYQRVDALEYRPPDPSKSPIRSYYFEYDGKGRYVDQRGRTRGSKGWRTPVPGAPITSPFNLKRKHPILKRIKPHYGTDFGAPSGTPVYAAFRGKVAWVGPRGAAGKLVLIDHPNGVQTGYAHLSRFAKGLKTGQAVGTRQLIGYIGSTGRSTGPHLHFSAKKNGKFFDAMKLKMDSLHPLPVSVRGAFLLAKQQLDRRIEAIALPEPPPEPKPKAPAEPAATAPTAPPQQHPEDRPAPASSSNTEAPPASTATDPDGDQDLVGEDLSQTPE